MLTLTPPASAEDFYRLKSVTPIPGDKVSWDHLALDAGHDRLFLGRRGAGVVVVDLKTMAVVQTIENSAPANGIVIVPEFDRGFTANSDGSTTVFELSSLKTLDRVSFGKDADAGFYDPKTKHVVFTMGDSNAAAFLDAATAKPDGTLPIASHSIEGGVADGAGAMFFALRDKGAAVRIDTVKRAVTATWQLGCDEPVALALDPASHRLFAGCRGKQKDPVLAVVDSQSGKPVARLPLGHGNDGVVWDADGKRVIASNGLDGNLVIYAQQTPDRYALAQAVTTRPMARTLEYDPRTRTVYTMTAEGIVDPAKKILTDNSPFYPNRFLDGSFVLLAYGPG